MRELFHELNVEGLKLRNTLVKRIAQETHLGDWISPQEKIIMIMLQSPVSHGSLPSSTISTKPKATALIPLIFSIRQTGTAVVTKLFSRVLFDIIQRHLAVFQHIASKSTGQ